MALHHRYKCKKCGQFHPAELDRLFKDMELFAVAHNTDEETTPLKKALLNARSTSAVKHQWRRSMKVLDKWSREVDPKMRLYEDGGFYVCKCLALNVPICIDELSRAFSFDPDFPSKTFHPMEHYLAKHHYALYQFLQVFVSDPVHHWVEVVNCGESQVKVKPVWFADARVYQMPVKVTMHGNLVKFTIKAGGTDVPVIQINHALIFGAKLSLLGTQVKYCKNLFTGKSIVAVQLMMTVLELRLVYYKGTKAPRVWVRAPATTFKVLEVNSAHFIPIATGMNFYFFNKYYNMI